jgi:hypothetical protein
MTGLNPITGGAWSGADEIRFSASWIYFHLVIA